MPLGQRLHWLQDRREGRLVRHRRTFPVQVGHGRRHRRFRPKANEDRVHPFQDEIPSRSPDRSTQGTSDSDLARSARHRLGSQTVDADDGQDECEEREQTNCGRSKQARGKRPIDKAPCRIKGLQRGLSGRHSTRPFARSRKETADQPGHGLPTIGLAARDRTSG